MTEYGGMLDIFLVLGAIFIIMAIITIALAGIYLFIIFVFKFCGKIEEKYEDFLNQLFS